MSAKYKSPSFLLPNELNTSANPANDTGVNSLYSMEFNGSSDYIDLGANFYQVGSGDVSISVWIKPQSQSGNNDIIAIGANTGSRIRLQRRGNNFGAYINNSAGSGSALTGSTTITNGVWYHLMLIKSGTTFTLYVNATSETSGTFTGTFDSQEGIIGAYFGGGSNNINGKIDEVAVFNRALDSTEIAALYDGSGSNIRPSNLMATDLNPIAYYPLGEQAQMQGYLGNEASSEWQFPNGVLQDYVMDFDSTSPGDYISAPMTMLNSATQCTISFWGKKDASNKELVVGGRISVSAGIWIQWYSNGSIYFSPRGTGATGFSISYTQTYDNDWHHYIGVYDGSSAANCKLYLDGNLVATGTGTPPASLPATTGDNFQIGALSTSHYTDGQISNVAVWNTAITDSAQIANIYNNGSPQTTYTVTPQNWWKLNADSVYTPSAPNYTTALDFDGTNDYISIPNSTDFNLGSSFTISGWFNITSYVSNMGYISFDGSTRGWFLFHQSTNLALYDGTAVRTLSSNLQPTNEWNSYIITYDGTDLIFYLNGQLNSTQSVTSNLQTNGNGGQIGNQQFAAGRFYNGSISNISIWNTALTPTQVSTLFNFGTPETNISFNPVAWWKLDNTTTGIQDSSGNGNNGTNNGATDISSGVAVTPSWKIPNELPIPTINTTSAINIGTAGTNPGPIGLNPYFDFDLSSVTTTSIWIKTPSSSTGAQTLGTILGNNGTSGGATSSSTILLALKNDGGSGNAYIETYDYGYLGNKITSNSYSIADFWRSKWHHILMIRNNQNVSFFIDGVAAGGGTFASSQSTTPVNVNAIGGALGNWYFQNGEISNLAIWNSDQSTNKDNIYNNGQPQSSYIVTPDHLFKLDNLTTGINDVYSSSAGTATSGVTKVDTNVYVGNIPVNGVSTTLPSTALQQSDLQFDSPYSNYSLSFDGAGDYVDVGNADSLKLRSGDFTFSTWINPNSWGSSYEGIYVNGATNGVWIGNGGNGNFVLRIYGVSNIISYSTLPTINTWTHICITRNSGLCSLFYNGSSVATATSTHDFNGSGNVFLGSDGGVADFNGNIDETSIFNYSLSEAQVLEIYNNGRPNDLSTFSGTAPVSWWRLGENAYFDNNSFIVPNSITGAPNGTGAGTITAMISADAPGTYANGIGTNLDILDRVGDAPLSTSNSQSYNMIPSDISPYVPQYVGLQTNNIYSMSFNGVDEYFTTGSTFSTFDGLNKLSISMWVKWDNVSTYRILASVTRDSTVNNFVWMLCNINNQLRFFASNTSEYCYSNYILTANTWTHVAVTMDKTQSTQANRCKIFINGVDETFNNTNNINSSPLQTSNSPLYIGENQNGKYSPMLGEIDEVAIWDTALNADQIKFDLYQPSLPAGSNKTADIANNTNLPTPVAWYRMGD